MPLAISFSTELLLERTVLTENFGSNSDSGGLCNGIVATVQEDSVGHSTSGFSRRRASFH